MGKFLCIMVIAQQKTSSYNEKPFRVFSYQEPIRNFQEICKKGVLQQKKGGYGMVWQLI